MQVTRLKELLPEWNHIQKFIINYWCAPLHSGSCYYLRGCTKFIYVSTELVLCCKTASNHVTASNRMEIQPWKLVTEVMQPVVARSQLGWKSESLFRKLGNSEQSGIRFVIHELMKCVEAQFETHQFWQRLFVEIANSSASCSSSRRNQFAEFAPARPTIVAKSTQQ